MEEKIRLVKFGDDTVYKLDTVNKILYYVSYIGIDYPDADPESYYSEQDFFIVNPDWSLENWAVEDDEGAW